MEGNPGLKCLNLREEWPRVRGGARPVQGVLGPPGSLTSDRQAQLSAAGLRLEFGPTFFAPGEIGLGADCLYGGPLLSHLLDLLWSHTLAAPTSTPLSRTF